MSSYQDIAPDVIEAAKTQEDAFIQLYRHYGDRVLRFLISRTGNRPLAEDLTQETFMTLLQKLPLYTNTGAKFSSWLLQIALNHLRMHFRKHSNAATTTIETLGDIFPAQEGHQTEWMDFFTALHKLSDDEQNILVMKYVEDLSNQDIAQHLNISPNTCGVQIHRALTQLQTYL